MTGKDERPAMQGRAPNKINRHHDADPSQGNRPRRQIPVARGVGYPPAGRRRRHCAVVERCPHCRHAHVHYGERWHDLTAVVKVGSCGRLYELHLSGLRLAEDSGADVSAALSPRVAEAVEQSRQRRADRQAARAEFGEARRHGVAQRHATKLAHQRRGDRR